MGGHGCTPGKLCALRMQARHTASAARAGSTGALVLPSVASLGAMSRRGSGLLPDSPMTAAGQSMVVQWPLRGSVVRQHACAVTSPVPEAL